MTNKLSSQELHIHIDDTEVMGMRKGIQSTIRDIYEIRESTVVEHTREIMDSILHDAIGNSKCERGEFIFINHE